jgi:hypothetical protein
MTAFQTLVDGPRDTSFLFHAHKAQMRYHDNEKKNRNYSNNNNNILTEEFYEKVDDEEEKDYASCYKKFDTNSNNRTAGLIAALWYVPTCYFNSYLSVLVDSSCALSQGDVQKMRECTLYVEE